VSVASQPEEGTDKTSFMKELANKAVECIESDKQKCDKKTAAAILDK